MSRFSDDSDETPPTRLVRNKAPESFSDAPTSVGGSADVTKKFDFEPMGGFNDGVPTPPPAPVPQPAGQGQKTVVFRPGAESRAKKHSDQPTTGWLVVVAGPGRGASLEISYGLSKLGRDGQQDIALDFGDEQISRVHHAAIEYDPKLRQFFLSKGENLVYHNGNRVGAGSECELKTGDEIEMGNTKLKFVAFCGPDFDWNGV